MILEVLYMAKVNYEKTAQRIKSIIDQKCGGSQQRFAEICGIGKYSVSQYVNAKNSPGNMTAVKISRAFGVDPLWVMGEDVPMYKDTVTQMNMMTEHEEDMFLKYRTLPPYYRKLIDDMIISLTESTAQNEAVFTPKDVLSND